MVGRSASPQWTTRIFSVLAVLVVLVGIAVQPSGNAFAGGRSDGPDPEQHQLQRQRAALAFSAPTELIGTTITSYNYEISTDGGTTAEATTNGRDTAPSTMSATTATPVPRQARTSIHTELITAPTGRRVPTESGRCSTTGARCPPGPPGWLYRPGVHRRHSTVQPIATMAPP